MHSSSGDASSTCDFGETRNTTVQNYQRSNKRYEMMPNEKKKKEKKMRQEIRGKEK